MTSIKNEIIWKKKFGCLLKETFNVYLIDREEFADEIHSSYPALRQWIAGNNFPSQSVLDSILKVLPVYLQGGRADQVQHMELYITNNIPECDSLVRQYRDDVEELVTGSLQLCYSYGKFGRPRASTTYESTGETRMVIFDFDGTLTHGHVDKTTWESIWTMLNYSVEDCRELHTRFNKGEITHEKWCDLTAEKFREAGLSVKTIYEIASDICLINGCAETFKTLKEHNISIYIVSGSIRTIIQEVLDGLAKDVKEIRANDFIFSGNGKFETIIGTPYDFDGKARFVREIAEMSKISENDILFVGNSYNDKYVHMTGAKMLCINPRQTDPKDWDFCIQECDDLRMILDYVVFEGKTNK